MNFDWSVQLAVRSRQSGKALPLAYGSCCCRQRLCHTLAAAANLSAYCQLNTPFALNYNNEACPTNMQEPDK